MRHLIRNKVDNLKEDNICLNTFLFLLPVTTVVCSLSKIVSNKNLYLLHLSFFEWFWQEQCPQMFWKGSVLNYFPNLIGKNLCRKVRCWRSAILLKETQARAFLCGFCKIFKSVFLQDTSWRLFLFSVASADNSCKTHSQTHAQFYSSSFCSETFLKKLTFGLTSYIIIIAELDLFCSYLIHKLQIKKHIN